MPGHVSDMVKAKGALFYFNLPTHKFSQFDFFLVDSKKSNGQQCRFSIVAEVRSEQIKASCTRRFPEKAGSNGLLCIQSILAVLPAKVVITAAAFTVDRQHETSQYTVYGEKPIPHLTKKKPCRLFSNADLYNAL
ncbi:hypothetical protein Baya_10904 [Bagarius yarrelli]|uniref:Uncharacterized protein n=1 Tax=Bagarius yarrelli TaxID=175774 RepID=A0A556V0T2_BAGYA|nr:hypothetical protein Baya_10904 [Bagarius yarrelli]